MSDDEDSSGDDERKSIEERIESLRFGADDGNAQSMYLLGAAHAKGAGVERDEQEAAKWFHKAAAKGHAKAKTSLAFLTATGRGARRDPVRAYVLLSEAAASGDLEATDMQIKLRRKMHESEIKRAEKQIRGG